MFAPPEQRRYIDSRLKLSLQEQNLSTIHDAGNNRLSQLDAVVIRNLTYEAGRGKGKKAILNKINLTVPEGSIYGLLGPSGCGKTTMLKCVVGRIKPRSGSVLVFGFRPGTGQSDVPGRDVGYMPQDISIYEDFTIEETLRYFGKINRMSSRAIKGRIDFLLKFLDLPYKRRLVANLSGGQKRRVSLGAALVHSPPLLILDEPTVGVDPLLRQSIWQHLVTLTHTERISVIITTHYIEEARQANLVGLMRHGRILAEDSPDALMSQFEMNNLEDVFLKLCVTDSSRHAAVLAVRGDKNRQSTSDGQHQPEQTHHQRHQVVDDDIISDLNYDRISPGADIWQVSAYSNHKRPQSPDQSTVQLKLDDNNVANSTPTDIDSIDFSAHKQRQAKTIKSKSVIKIHTGTNKIEIATDQDDDNGLSHTNEAIEVFSSEEDDFDDSDTLDTRVVNIKSSSPDKGSSPEDDHLKSEPINYRKLIENAAPGGKGISTILPRTNQSHDITVQHRHRQNESDQRHHQSFIADSDDYIAMQALRWAARRNNELGLMNLRIGQSRKNNLLGQQAKHLNRSRFHEGSEFYQWWKTLMAVTWKNYVRLRRNPPVLVFQFMLPAVQVILFCLCIGGEPFDVPVAIVNDEVVPKSSLQFLNGLNRKIIRQVKYDNLSSAISAVKRGDVWGAIHIPDKYSENLQSRLIMGEEVTNETISNGTIKVYPDLTNLHLALALETTFRETFINFARNSLEELGYDKSLADLPIQVGKPVYGTLKKDGYLEFMAPGVVISISYVMATGLTALAFILERRDGLLERSLVSGVQTSQILLAHAINQVFVMSIQIFLVLGCTFFIFEIPSRGPFVWVVLLILLQGCTGMGFGLLVSAICAEENTAVMMVVGTFYTNLILAGIIWPIEAMPHWLRPLSYAQPQTLPTTTLRHILSRGWGILDQGVLLGFAVTIGWLAVFLLAAGIIFKYSR